MADLPAYEDRVSWFFDASIFLESRMDPNWKIDITKAWDAGENEYVSQSWMPVLLCPAHPETPNKPRSTWRVSGSCALS